MIKKGFTLAEVLITLGIVGVISALTLPSLMNNHTKAQIGPKLAKAVSAFDKNLSVEELIKKALTVLSKNL